MKHNTRTAESDRRSALRMLIGGILGMMVAMGISRFAYTPILPLMQRDLGLSNSLGGVLASMNYIGYLAGALLCALLPTLIRSRHLNACALVASIATSALMAFVATAYWWAVLRLVAGFASAILFVVIAVEVSTHLGQCRLSRWNSALYAGVGLGIAVSGGLVPLFDRFGGWQAAWLGMAAVALLLAAGGISIAGKRQAGVPVSETTGMLQSMQPCRIGRLALAYFFEGMGYIVSATFLVSMVAHQPNLSALVPWVWVLVGLSAAPSTIIWQLVAQRIGSRAALTAAYMLQSCGILLSILSDSVLCVGLSALLFGGTFLGIVALVMGEGGRRCTGTAHRTTALLTACFGAGQVIAPSLAGLLADYRGSFALPLMLAAALAALAGLLTATDRRFQQHIPSRTP